MKWQDQFPENFRKHEAFPKLETAVEAVINHPALRLRKQHVIDNMIRASLVFTVCFYGNLIRTLSFYLERKAESPFAVDEDNGMLYLFLQLAIGELATKNIPTEKGLYSPHYVAMREAAIAAGIDVRKIDDLVRDAHSTRWGEMEGGHTNLIKEWEKYSKVSDAISSYLFMSIQDCNDNRDCFPSIAIRELTLSANFRTLLEYLPVDATYDKYRIFLRAHVELDEGEHAALMSKALESIDSDFVLDRAFLTMIDSYKHRKAVYDACLNEASIL
jgi:hypothetical protein